MKKKYKIRVIRYNPETEKFKNENFQITAGDDITVLEALHIINKKFRAGLSYRFSCGMGVCGSCAAIVNGKHVLLCQTFCKNLSQPIEIRPLRNFPIIKDLVVDIDSAFNKIRSAMPYTDIAVRHAPKNMIQTEKQRKKIEQASQCIKCMLCYSACPVYGLKNDFIGPAAAATAYKYNRDNRDTLFKKRLSGLTDNNGVWNCTHVGECSAVCPKNVDPNKAITKLKIMGALNGAKNILKKK